MSSNAFGAIEREQLRRDALRDQEKTEREANSVIPSAATDPRTLAADLRRRINPAYANQIGTESYERRLCAESIESLMEQRDELLMVAEDAITLLTNEDGKELAPLWAKRARAAITTFSDRPRGPDAKPRSKHGISQ